VPPLPGEPGSGSRALRRSGSLGGSALVRRSGLAQSRSRPSPAGAGADLDHAWPPLPKQALAWLSSSSPAEAGSGSRASWASSRDSTLPFGRGLLVDSHPVAPSPRWGRACRLLTVSRRRRLLGSELPCCLGLRCTEVPARLSACLLALPRLARARLATGVARRSPLCVAPRHRAAPASSRRPSLRPSASCPRAIGSSDPKTRCPCGHWRAPCDLPPPIRRSRLTGRGPRPEGRWLAGSGPDVPLTRLSGPCGLGLARRFRACFQDATPASSTTEWPTSRPFSADESVVTSAVSGGGSPYPSMGFVPLQGPPLAALSSRVARDA
jgi:hypothetical protein